MKLRGADRTSQLSCRKTFMSMRADSGQTAQSVILDADRMIVEKLHTDDQAQILGAIQQALSP